MLPTWSCRLILQVWPVDCLPTRGGGRGGGCGAGGIATRLTGRRDLRDLITFTIDGETARDFDDAVSLELLANGHVRPACTLLT
jgi:hypothetical protein